MVLRDEMMFLFKQVLDGQQPVTLINTYRGFPISYPASLMAVDQGYVAMTVHEYQAVAIALEGKTYMQSSMLPEVIQGTAVGVDVARKRVAVTELKGVGQSVGRRSSIRVQPSAPIDVEIYDERRRIAGKIADISTRGVGVFTFAAYIYGDQAFEKDKEVYIDFRLPNADTILHFQGVIAIISAQKATFMHRLGMKIFPTSEVEPLLQEYIDQRKNETMLELKLVYESMSRQKAE
ncbi:MAG: hypothetical protein A2Z49_07075 [Chloroflexi bacterium RBG_19FT_COMBO_56_12]|nr:MAG: hypothetical protein A2Z49_07075 [Chloroflexi bacterium RBG_19FT_COMBO_56_12]